MKKILKFAIGGLFVLFAALFAFGYLFLDRAVKTAVETVGPEMTQTSVAVKGVSISIFGGSGKISQLAVGNPEGFKSERAVFVQEIKTALKVSSALSDPLVIESLVVEAPEVTYELGPGGGNLNRIQKNIEAYQQRSKSERKVIIKDLRVLNGKINVRGPALLGQELSVPLPDLHLTNLGESSGGETMSEIMSQIIGPLMKNVLSAVKDGMGGSLKNLDGVLENLEGPDGKGGKALDKVKGLFGK